MTDDGAEPYVRFDAFDASSEGWELRDPERVCEAWTRDEVPAVLAEVEEQVARGRHAGGFVTYEAAGALDPSLTTHASSPGLPLAWFGIFRQRIAVPLPAPPPADLTIAPRWTPSLSAAEHASRVAAIREWIAAGDSYQVNLTFPLTGKVEGDDLALYAALGWGQRAGYSALLRLPSHSIVSASPELFFRWRGRELELRPMKGTRPRGRWGEEDEARAEELRHSPKDRAENLMIVDLLRNDAGRVAEYGSVAVERLFEVERYPTVLQLTSSIRARTRPEIGLKAIFEALFPCGSVTGAPKVRTMQIITDLEAGPRGVYAGAIGMVSPGEAVFNVPIRTVLLRRDTGEVEMGVGSGITHDSEASAEYAECLQKAAFTRHRPPRFGLLETLLYTPDEGIHYRSAHIERMRESAAFFGFRMDAAEVGRLLDDAARGGREARRIRLILAADGGAIVETMPLSPQPDPLRARLALAPVDSADPLLQHKTTWRAPYEERLMERPGYDEVLLINERGELTEFANGNLVVRLEGVDWTPPRDCGLLPGVLRNEMLERGELRERVLYPAELERAEGIWRINSVRGRVKVEVKRMQ